MKSLPWSTYWCSMGGLGGAFCFLTAVVAVEVEDVAKSRRKGFSNIIIMMNDLIIINVFSQMSINIRLLIIIIIILFSSIIYAF